MNPIDDLFRDGLEGRSGEVPEDMWSRIKADASYAAPEGAEVDKFFAEKLADRTGEVPADMWPRIAAGAATATPDGAALDKVFAEGLKERSAAVPAGMWERIWSSVPAPVAATSYRRRWLAAGLAILLLFLGGLAWQEFQEGNTAAPVLDAGTPAVAVTAGEKATIAGSRVAGARQPVDEKKAGEILPRQDDAPAVNSIGTVTGAGDLTTAGMPKKLIKADGARSAAMVAEQLAGDISKIGAAGLNNAPVSEEASVDTEKPSPVPADYVVSGRDLPAATPALIRDNAIDQLSWLAAPLQLKRTTRIQPLTDGFVRVSPRHRFQTELLFGAAYARQEFTALTPDQSFLREVRETSEFPDLSYQVSLRGSYKLSDRLLVLGGLTYAEIRNEFEHEPIINGQPQLVRTTNRIRQLEVPLLLGFRLPGERLSVSLNAGPVINLTTSAQGKFLDPDVPQTRDLATDGNYRRNTGVGFMTSLSTTYKIGKKEPFLLLVEPFFKAYPGSFTVEGAPLKEKYWVAGLQLGVRRSF